MGARLLVLDISQRGETIGNQSRIPAYVTGGTKSFTSAVAAATKPESEEKLKNRIVPVADYVLRDPVRLLPLRENDRQQPLHCERERQYYWFCGVGQLCICVRPQRL